MDVPPRRPAIASSQTLFARRNLLSDRQFHLFSLTSVANLDSGPSNRDGLTATRHARGPAAFEDCSIVTWQRLLETALALKKHYHPACTEEPYAGATGFAFDKP